MAQPFNIIGTTDDVDAPKIEGMLIHEAGKGKATTSKYAALEEFLAGGEKSVLKHKPKPILPAAKEDFFKSISEAFKKQKEEEETMQYVKTPPKTDTGKAKCDFTAPVYGTMINSSTFSIPMNVNYGGQIKLNFVADAETEAIGDLESGDTIKYEFVLSQSVLDDET